MLREPAFQMRFFGGSDGSDGGLDLDFSPFLYSTAFHSVIVSVRGGEVKCTLCRACVFVYHAEQICRRRRRRRGMHVRVRARLIQILP